MNRQYLEAIRANSCYPTFRGFVQIFTLLGYLVAAVVAIAGFFTGQIGTMILAFAGAIIVALLIRVGKEMSLMLADIADVAIDSSSKATAANSSPTPNTSQQTVVATPEDDATAMAHYGITFDGEKYQFQSFKYDKLNDAISYARRQSSTS